MVDGSGTGLALANSMAASLARAVASNGRDLEGGLNRLVAQWQFTGQPVKMDWHDATKLFGRGPDAPTISSVLKGENQEAAKREHGYTPGQATVRFAGYDDWTLPTADELDLLGAYRQNNRESGQRSVYDDWSAESTATGSVQARLKIFPWFNDRPTPMIWSATGQSIPYAWAAGDKWPVGDFEKSRLAATVFFVRHVAPIAVHDDYEDFAIAVPMMPPGMHRLITTVYNEPELPLKVAYGQRGARVAQGELILEYWIRRFVAPCAGRINFINDVAYSQSDRPDAEWPRNVGTLFTIQPVRGQDLEGVMQRAWSDAISWYEEVITNRDKLSEKETLAGLIPEIEGHLADLTRMRTLKIRKVSPDYAEALGSSANSK